VTRADGEGEALPPRGEALGTWSLLYAFSGFCALGLELVWFRVFEVSVKASAFTFGALLAVYLLGNGIGSLFGSWWAPRLRQPLHAFLLAQCVLLAYAAAVLVLLVRLPPETPGLGWYYAHWGTSKVLTLGAKAREWAPWIRLYAVLPVLLFGPPTLLMGFSYPVLQRAVQDDPRTSGRKVGLLQAANIGGCVAGSLIVGLLLLDRLGTPGTLAFLLVCGLVFAAVGFRRYGPRSAFAPAAVALGVVLVLLPDGRAFWLRFHGTSVAASTLVAEDATGVVMLVQNDQRWAVWAGGRSHSWLPFGSTHTVLGAAPAIVHPAPGRVAVIGLGSGDTAWASGCRRDVAQRIDVYEIYAQEKEVLRRLTERPGAPPELAPFLQDPRFAFLVKDGRNALLHSRPQFDVVEMDALWPVSPYSGNLYSREFFGMVAARLRKNGLMCIWAPTDRVRIGFVRTFPHVVSLLDDQVLIGSLDPIPMDPATWRHRLDHPQVSSYLGETRTGMVWNALVGAREMVVRPSMGREVNEDLFPRDEFRTRDR
jgi:spermidine synthase